MRKLMIPAIIFIGLASSCGQRKAQELEHSDTKGLISAGKRVAQGAKHLPVLVGQVGKNVGKNVGNNLFIKLIDETRNLSKMNVDTTDPESVEKQIKLVLWLMRLAPVIEGDRPPNQLIHFMNKADEAVKDQTWALESNRFRSLLNELYVWKNKPVAMDSLGKKAAIKRRVDAIRKEIEKLNSSRGIEKGYSGPIPVEKQEYGIGEVELYSMWRRAEALSELYLLTETRNVLEGADHFPTIMQDWRIQALELKPDIPDLADMPNDAFLKYIMTSEFHNRYYGLNVMEKALVLLHNTLSSK